MNTATQIKRHVGTANTVRRRAAFLEFPRQSFFKNVIDGIADEGYDDVCLSIIPSRDNMGNSIEQGFTVTQGRQLHDWCAARGLGVLVFTGYMKYDEPLLAKEPHRAMITFGSSDLRDSDGAASQWLCPFQPANRKRYWEDVIAPTLEWPGLRHIDLNDEAFLGFPSGALGCYCEHCCNEFKKLTGSRPPRPSEAKDALWWQWMEGRGQRWTAFHAGLRADIQKLRPDVTVGIQHSPCAPLFQWNNSRSAIDLGRDAAALDGLCTDPYHFLHLSVATLRPHRRLLAEAVRSLAGACGEDRQLAICTQGFMPPGNSTPLGRSDGVLSALVPFALGANLVFPYTYELSRIVAGFDDGWRDGTKVLPQLRKSRPAPFVTVVAPMKTEAHAHVESDWAAERLVPLMDVMHRIGLPWQWIYDERINPLRQIATVGGPIVVPNATALTQDQLTLLGNHKNGLLRIGQVADGRWSGHGLCRVEQAPAVRGPVELILDRSAISLFGDLAGPLILTESVAQPPQITGRVIGTINGKPGLVVDEQQGCRTAWLSGTPVLHVPKSGMHAAVVSSSASIDLLRRLLLWLSPKAPAACFDPQPITDYTRLRPWDVRGINTAELFPMIADDGLLMVIFNYMPVGFDAGLQFSLPEGRSFRSLKDLWSSEDLTASVQSSGDGSYRLPIRFDGNCDAMVLWASHSVD